MLTRGGLMKRGSDRLTQVSAWVKRRFRRFRRASIQNGEAVLADVAHHKSCRVTDVASRLKLRLGPTIAAISALERQELVRLSKDQSPLYPVVAITSKGREEVRR
jgi:DNA-binding MarR family transcriptional regulator